MTINTLLWLCAAGISAAILISYYNSRFLGKLVRALLDIDATSTESAISLEDLGIKLNYAVKNSLRPGKSLTHVINKTEDGKYYIIPEKASMAKAKYRGKDISIVYVSLIIATLLVICLLLTFAFPDLLESLSNKFSSTIRGN